MTPRLSPQKYIKQVARKLPIKQTYITEDIFESGLGHVIVLREKKNGEIVIGGYMVDVFACGVKDTFFNIVDKDELLDFLMSFTKTGLKLEEHPPNYVFNLIYGAVEYAEDLGIKPHKEFALTSYILPDVDDIEFEEIEFGENGKPLYIPGEHDNVNQILSILNKNVGKGNYNYIPQEKLLENGHIEERYDELSEEDQAELTYYTAFAIAAYNFSFKDLTTLKNIWSIKPKKLMADIYKFDETFDLKNEDHLDSMVNDMYDFNMAIIENIIIRDGINFLKENDFINCFDSTIIEDYYNDINRIGFKLYGNNKINQLFYILSVFIFEMNSELDEKSQLPSHKNPVEFYEKYLEGKYKEYELFYGMELIIDLIQQHSLKISPLDKESLANEEFNGEY